MKLRQRADGVKYVSDSVESSQDNSASEASFMLNKKRQKDSSSFNTFANAGALLRYAQPNVKNTAAPSCLSPEKVVHTLASINDSDEDFVDCCITRRKRITPRVTRHGSRSARRSYKELSSSGSEYEGQEERSQEIPDLSSFCFQSTKKGQEAQKVLVPGRKRLVKAISLLQEDQENSKVSYKENKPPNVESHDEEELSCRKSLRVLQKKASTLKLVSKEEDLSEDSISERGVDDDEPTDSDLQVDAYELCTSKGESITSTVKRYGQVERILAVRNRNKDAATYTIKECGKSYRGVVVVKEAVLKSKCPQLLRNFIKKMDEMQRIDGNLGDRDDAPAFDPLYLQVDRVISKEERRGGRRYYLVKWRGLPYTEVTWELHEDLKTQGDKAAIARYLWIHSSSARGTLEGGEELVFRDGRVLRDYQEKGLAWMDHNFQSRVNCILADEMGLGKTMQAVSMLQNLRVKRKIRGPFMVIAPVSTLGHWQREVESLTDMNCVVYCGSAEDRGVIREHEIYYPRSNQIKFNVLLTSFEMLMKDHSFISKHKWCYVVVDEAHRLKSKDSKTTCRLKQLNIRNGGLLLLTGTPVQNNTKEIFSLLNLLDSERFCSEEEFLLKYGDLKNAEQVRDLQESVLRPRLLRRLKEDVEKSIPLKEETIIWVELTKEQRCYYRAILENRISDLLKGSLTNNMPNLRNVAMELRKLCNHPFLCNGLQEDITSKSRPADARSDALCFSSGKMMLLDKLLPMLKNAGHRVLLFSQFAIMLDLLEDYLILKGYTYERIDGSVRGSERQAAIDRYSAKDSDTFLFLLSTRAGGLGITLTAADTCIIYDSDWNPQNDLQAMARCHRIGQKKDVRIYRLITRNTYEQHLFECSSRKYGLDEAILGGMQEAVSDEHNVNIENLLKKGAYNILKEDGEADAAAFHAQNIEQILESRTEKRLVGGRGQNTFSVATFISCPQTDSMDNDTPSSDGSSSQFWQELLPEACANLLHANKQAQTSCGPRKRQSVNYRERHEVSESESSDEEDGTTRGRRHRLKKKSIEEADTKDGIKQWSEKELKRLEDWLMELGKGRSEEIMAEAQLQHHGLPQVQELSDVLISLCQYFQARNELLANNMPAKCPNEAAVIPPKDSQSLPGSRPSKDKAGGWSASTFRNLPEEAGTPAEPDHRGQQAEDVNQMLGPFEAIAHPTKGKIEVPLFPSYAKRALSSQGLIKRLQKKAIRYLQVLQERETLATACRDGKVLPPSIHRTKKLPNWWSEAEDADLLLGAHRHGHRSFHKMREDKSLCFSSRLDSLKANLLKENPLPAPAETMAVEAPSEVFHEQDPWPHDNVLATRLKHLIQALQIVLSLPDGHKISVLKEALPMPLGERMKTSSLASDMHRPHGLSSHKQHIPRTTHLKQAKADISNMKPTALSSQPGTINDQKLTNLAKRRLPLPLVGLGYYCRPSSEENLHWNEVVRVLNSTSESSDDENFERGDSSGRFYRKQCMSLLKKGHPTTVLVTKNGISQHPVQTKENKNQPSAVLSKSISVSAMQVKEKLGTPKQLKPQDFGLHGEMYQTGATKPQTSSASNRDQALLEKNGSVVKRKALTEVPLATTKKMMKENTGKQQTLHGFLAPKPSGGPPPAPR